MSYIRLDREPPLRPRTYGGKAAISCHKPFEFLIRAWAPQYTIPSKLVDWICHHIGRMDLAGLEWWGFTYPGQPPYMNDGRDWWTSGLTIQRFVAPPDSWTQKALDEGRLGPSYGPPVDLEIPELGQVQVRHVACDASNTGRSS